VTKKKPRSASPLEKQGGKLLALLLVLLAACVPPAAIGIYNLFSHLGTATVVGLDPSSLHAEPHERSILSDFPVHTRLSPAIAQRMALVVEQCRATAAAKPLQVVLVFDGDGEIHDVVIYGEVQFGTPGGANSDVSKREACVRQVTSRLRVAWSPTQRYRLYVGNVTL
jgi:hypothetical protein